MGAETKNEQNQSLWKDRNFITIYISFFISGIGDGISKIALLWLSYELTNSSAAMGLVFACLTLPGIFSGLLSGALADRYSKRKIFITARIVLGILVAGFVLAYLYKSIFLVYVLSFLMGASFSFDGGPFRAYLPEIFSKEKLAAVNTAVSSARSLSMLIGPALGGIILEVGNVSIAFLIDAATFFISAAIMRILPSTLPRMVEGSVKAGAIFQDIKRGVAYLLRSPLHRFLMFFFVSLFGIYCFSGGLITPLCKEVLSVSNNIKGSTVLAIIQATFGLGGLISLFFIPFFMKKFGYLHTLLFGAFLCVVELFAFGCISNIYFLAVITTFTAASGPMLMVPLFTFMQENTAPRFMGRAMGALDTVILAVISFSFGFGGIVADIVGIINVFIITACLIQAFVIIIPFLPAYKAVHKIEEDQIAEKLLKRYGL